MYFNKLLCVVIGVVITTNILIAQKETRFTENQKIYLKGASRLIGNTMVGEHPVNSFDNFGKRNDQVDIVYTDIDTDSLTFSSSKATISPPSDKATIIYAGLYWGGLYPSQISTMRKGKRKMKYKAVGARDENVQNVLLKANSGGYIQIKGRVIYNSKGEGPYSSESPYVCYAEVTSQLQGIASLNTITVANVRATQGFMEGGSAAGWMLYVVYEDVSQSATYFTTYDGFNQVNEAQIVLDFDDFKTKNTEKVKASIVIAALEGDIQIESDVCAIFDERTQSYINLTTNERAEKNFFNSSITTPYKEFSKRTPSSQNTLGLDLVKMSLPDSTITKNTESASLQLSTKADRFYPFFVAFETEIEETYLKEKNPNALMAVDIKVSEEIMHSSPLIKEVVVKDTVLVKSAPVVSSDVKETSIIKKEKPKSKPKDLSVKRRSSLMAEGLAKGYYLVTNVFKESTNATSWKRYLNEQGYTAQIFIDDRNKHYYVYINNSRNFYIMRDRKEVLEQISFLKDIWVARVNFN